MTRKLFISILFVTLGCLHLSAQDDYRKAFDEFTENAKNCHAAFTDTANVIFAKAIGADWTRFELSEGDKRQTNPEPDVLPIADGTQTVYKVVTVTEAVDTIPARWPLETDSAMWMPQEPVNKHNSRVVKFLFYDAEQMVSVPKEYGTFHPKGIAESDVAAFWEELSQYDYKLILADCAKYVEGYGYNDWAVLEWVQALSEKVFPRNIHSERTIFTVFLLNQMGLMTKIARADSNLISLFSAMQPVYARKYIVIDTYPFYLAEKTLSASEVFTYKADFMKPAHPLDLRLHSPMKLGKPQSYTTIRKSSPILNTSFDIPVNQAQVRFYSDYPQTAASVYATAKPESRFANALTDAVGSSITNLPTKEAVDKILAFVQTDFKYQTDIEQFGFEKPFFCEENFVYNYNDCEDRASLFTFLVKELTNCDVVLLEYPDHISTAVHIDDNVQGDHVRIKDLDYYVCDPSFIGATLGMTIPKYKNIAVKVYVL